MLVESDVHQPPIVGRIAHLRESENDLLLQVAAFHLAEQTLQEIGILGRPILAQPLDGLLSYVAAHIAPGRKIPQNRARPSAAMLGQSEDRLVLNLFVGARIAEDGVQRRDRLVSRYLREPEDCLLADFLVGIFADDLQQRYRALGVHLQDRVQRGNPDVVVIVARFRARPASRPGGDGRYSANGWDSGYHRTS